MEGVYDIEEEEYFVPTVRTIKQKVKGKVTKEVYYLDDLTDLDLSEKGLTKVELNTVDLPLFSRSPRLKKNESKEYSFDRQGIKTLIVEPGQNQTIPQAFDEKIFLGLCTLHKEQNYSKKIYFNNRNIREICMFKSDGKKLYEDINASLKRMAKTSYTFKDLFYDGIEGKKIDGEKVTHMFEIDIFKSEEAGEAPEKAMQMLEDKRVKTIYELTFSDSFYANIINSGYLLLDIDKLLKVEDDIAGKIYRMMIKWKFQKLYLKKSCMFIASRIPLSWQGKGKYHAVKRIVESLEMLKEKNLIKNFKYTKNKKIEQSFVEVEFYFEAGVNQIITGQEDLEILSEKTYNLSEEAKEEIKEKIKELCSKHNLIESNMINLFAKHKDKDENFIMYCINKSIKKVAIKSDYIKYFHKIISIPNVFIEFKERENKNKAKPTEKNNKKQNSQEILLQIKLEHPKEEEVILFEEEWEKDLKNKPNIGSKESCFKQWLKLKYEL